MKKKVLTLLGALAALGLAACDPAAPASSAPASTPASSQPAASSKPASSKPASSKPASSSKPADPVADATGHIWAADTDVAADAEAGTVAYKKAVTTTPTTDKAVRFKVNESVVTLNEGSTRKDRTPEGYIKVTSDGMGFSFKIKVDKDYSGKLYLFGVMDGWSSNTGASFFNNGTQNTKIEVNGTEVNMDAEKKHTYGDYFADGDPAGDNLSPEGYAPTGNIVLRAGVNEIKYTRVKTLNMLIKDFVFVVEEAKEWSDPTTVPADATAGTVGYKKYVNNFDGSIKIEFAALDGTMAEGSSNKEGTPEGYLKLNSNGNSISYKFNLDANLDGKLYQRGMMDSYDANKKVTYYSQTKGAKHGNFKATLNGSTVYYGDKKDVTYGSMLGDATQTINDGKKDVTYSMPADCLIGDGFLKNGENTFTFERVDSYNLAISDFVFIGKAASAHAALDETAEWKYDEISVWQEMPNDTFKWNRVDSEWGPDTQHPDEPATCVAPGKTYEAEKTSGLSRSVDTPINPNAHAWVPGESVKNSDDKDVFNVECSACHETGIAIAATSYSNADAVDSVDASKGVKAKSNAEFEWKVVLPKDVYFSIALDMKCDKNLGEAMSSRGFKVKVNDVEVPTTFDATKSPNDLGMSASKAATIVLADSAQIARDANNEVSIKLSCVGYRLYYTNYLVLTEVEAPTPTPSAE
ncbi:MAG: hypothetical protein VZR76_02510 [Candidatus Enteromonas sp.]|nr:hypothetical protein [Candidatus Enteromonas sp.]